MDAYRTPALLMLLAVAASVGAQTPNSNRIKPEDRQQATPSSEAPGGQVTPGATADTAPKNFLWSQLDANDDNFLSPSEAAADDGVARQFRHLDTNKDLKLDATEFSAYLMAPSTKQEKKK